MSPADSGWQILGRGERDLPVSPSLGTRAGAMPEASGDSSSGTFGRKIMNWYLLSPDCIGLDGHMTTSESGAPILHVIADLPADSDLLQSGGCIIATSVFVDAIKGADLSGYSVEDCIVSLGDQFMEGYSENFPLPPMRRIVIEGTPFDDDFALDERGYPIVSSTVVQLLNAFRYNHSDTVVMFGGEAAERMIAHRRKSYK